MKGSFIWVMNCYGGFFGPETSMGSVFTLGAIPLQSVCWKIWYIFVRLLILLSWISLKRTCGSHYNNIKTCWTSWWSGDKSALRVDVLGLISIKYFCENYIIFLIASFLTQPDLDHRDYELSTTFPTKFGLQFIVKHK